MAVSEDDPETADVPMAVSEDDLETEGPIDVSGAKIVESDLVLANQSNGNDYQIRLIVNGSTLLTGQSTKITIMMDNIKSDITDTLRVYFQMEDGSSIADNGKIFGYAMDTEMTFGSGISRFTGRFHKVANASNLYYLEMTNVLAGNTGTLDLSLTYPNWTTAGGTMLAWLDNSKGTTPPTQVKKATWTTQKSDYNVKESTSTTPSIKGDGTQDGEVYVSNLSYNVYMTSTATSDYGKNPVKQIEYQSALTLPDGFSWNRGLLDQVKNGVYTVTSSSSSWTISTTIEKDGTTTSYELAKLSVSSSSYKSATTDVKPVVTEDGLAITWTQNNTSTSTSTDISLPTYTVSYGSQLIIADTTALATAISENGGSSVTRQFTNAVTTTETFLYGDDKLTQNATASSTSTVGTATFSISKSASSSPYMGKPLTYTISLTNSSILPYTDLDKVTDTLPTLCYIKPADMDTMFADTNWGKNLSITISNLTVYNSFQTETVTNVSGSDVVQTHPNFSGSSQKQTVTIQWAEDLTHLVMQIDGTEYGTIGDGGTYASLEAAFASLPYMVFQDTTYTCAWDLTGQTLNSGETKKITIPATAKTTFMYLTADKEEVISSSYYYPSNTAYAYYVNADGSTSKKSAYKSTSIYRDFNLTKGVTFAAGDSISGTAVITPGQVLCYTNTATASYTVAYDALAMTDTLTGGQVMLVSVDENKGNASLESADLDTMEVSGKSYYILDWAGTYENVWVNGKLADSITVTETASGKQTDTVWYLSLKANAGTQKLSYYALVDPDRAGYMAGDGKSATTFSLDSTVYLNDLNDHRLYDTVGLKAARVSMDKNIVTNAEAELTKDHDYEQDALADNSQVHVGETVTYRLRLTSVSNTDTSSEVTVNGSDISDVLPVSLHNYWTQDNVSVTYVPTSGSEVTISDETKTGWYITTPTEKSTGETQQTLKWNSDFTLTLKGTLYIYVQVTFPDNSGSEKAWTEYAGSYGDATLKNTWKVYQMADSVTHSLSVQAEAMLEKGVYATGTTTSTSSYAVYGINTYEDSRWYYTNDTTAYGIVTYYIALYNSGSTKLYLEDIQDVLPEGFTFLSLYNNSGSSYNLDKYVCDYSGSNKTSAYNSGYYKTLLSLETGVTYKTAYIKATTSRTESGNARVTFTLSGSGTSSTTIGYDSSLGKYYLNSNEAVVIAYSCRTNGYNANVEDATNQAAMPYYDYNGAGVTLTQGVEATMKLHTALAENNGSASLTTTAQVEGLGVDVSKADTSTQWLSSSVTVQRGAAIPGIQKSCNASSAPKVTDSIGWTVTAYNEGTDNLLDYTLTDVMMTPYQFTGAVTYQLYNAKGTSITSAITLFSFNSRAVKDDKVTITYSSKSATLTVGGPAVTISNSTLGNLEVSLSRDASTGNEQLSIRFTDQKAALVPGGTGLLRLSTLNYTTNLENKSYTNECYITPMDQEFDSSLVTHGNAMDFTVFQEESQRPSVHGEAVTAVSYGYSTTAVKAVTELNADLSEMANTTTSDSSTNYIVLSKDTDSMFRYSLTMNNTGGASESKAVSKYVLVDNLPQDGDHTTLNSEYARYSDFQVDFADPEKLQFEVSVTTSGVKNVLEASQYSLQFSKQTEFDYTGATNAVWDGDTLTATDGWYTLEECTANSTLGQMRSVRVVIDDASLTGLMPGGAKITVSFNAMVDPNADTDYSDIAWNSFAYRYTVVDNGTMQAAPLKVGVKLQGIPYLQKSLLDENGKAYTAIEDQTFQFLIYQGKSQGFDSSVTDEEKMKQLTQAGIPFTVASITVKAGTTQSEQMALDSLKLWTYDSAAKEGTENWTWTSDQAYTVTELLGDGTGDFGFSSLGGKASNSYTFTYRDSASTVIRGVNQRKSWELLVHATDESGALSLEGAVCGLYSKEQPKTVSISDSAQKLLIGTAPQTYVDAAGTTWYLTAVQATGTSGQTEFTKLVGDTYLLRELQAPSGYVIKTETQQIKVPKTKTGTLEVTVTNVFLTVPTGILQNTSGLLTIGLLLLGVGALWLLKKRMRLW
jgi:uncharacterized repeat protein (TIGR01451 family)